MPVEPLITITGRSVWADRAVNHLHRHGFLTRRYDDPDHLIDDLLDHYPVLLLVGSDDPLWERRVRVVKAEQATRRIPVLVLLSDAAMQQTALEVGADVCLLADDLDTLLIAQVQQSARLLPPEEQKRLRCQCREDLPPLAHEGIKRFNAGAYHAQHDSFEELWMAETGPVRELYRVTLQVGVAYYHISRGNYAGGLKMLRRTVQWFAVLPDECQGINVRQLREDAERVRAALQAMNPADIHTFDRTLFKPVPLV